MSRGLWFVAGAGAGVYAVVRARRAAEVFTADGLRDRWSGLTLGARLLREEVAQGQADKEAELRVRYGLVPSGAPALAGGRHRAGAAPQPVGQPGSQHGTPHAVAGPVPGSTPTPDEEGST
ncbi:DUF6167 family protein [Nocardioides sp. GCM10027113]|uniref:DUF6167 family protein n=1 Tax=unclassified Nocardioides TaxID=2615069 RepID=UPI003612FCB7